MLIDGRKVGERRFESDVCIVGGGPAGLILAAQFLSSRFRVSLIEAGDETHQKRQLDWLGGGVASGSRHPPAHLFRQRRLGGTSGVWGGRCVPLDRIDFTQRDHVPLSGWPISYEEIEPYYERALDALDAGCFDFSAHTALQGRPFIAGFHDAALPTAGIERFSTPTDCWTRFGAALRAAPNITIVSNASCIGFEEEEPGRIAKAVLKTEARNRFEARAIHFVAAVGGLEIVRLLSGDGAGRAIANDMLGRGYMCHIEVTGGQLRLAPPTRAVTASFDRTSDGVYAQRRFSLSEAIQADHGLLNAAARLHHPSVADPGHKSAILSAMYLTKQFVIPEYRRKLTVQDQAAYARAPRGLPHLLRHARNMALGVGELAGFAADWIPRRYFAERRIPYVALQSSKGVYAIDYNSEQAPNLSSQVRLSDSRDQFGIHRLQIDWRMSDLDRQSALGFMQILQHAMARSACGSFSYDSDEVIEQLSPIGGHHIGAARMARDPAAGVVDEHCRVHGTRNLFVSGSAVFPTSGNANPTLTIAALTCRLADHLKNKLYRPRVTAATRAELA